VKASAEFFLFVDLGLMKYLAFFLLFFITLSCRTHKPIAYSIGHSKLVSVERTKTDSFYITVRGKIIDINPNRGEPVSYASIELTIYKRKFFMITDTLGRFQFQNLIPGNYKIFSSLVGFDVLQVDSFYLDKGETIDMVIGLGGITPF
jgi:hypothetical protein